MNYQVYILKSLKNGHYYIGQTRNLRERIKVHNLGRSKSTKSGAPWTIIYQEPYKSRKEAIKREKELKRIKKRYILESIIAG